MRQDDVAELNRMRDKIDSVRGDGVINTPRTIAILPQRRQRRYPRPGTIGTVIVQATGNATCGGVYTCRKWIRPTSDISVSASTFSMATLGTDPGSDDGYLFNLPETGKATHDLTAAANAGSAKLVLALPWYTNSDGKIVYLGLQVYPGC